MGDVGGYHQCIRFSQPEGAGEVQHVYVNARGELVGVALRLRMGLSLIVEWIEWDSDRGSDGSWLSKPLWVG